ncbi:unnamed protein product [Pseudo-nitzschia multistriata]|uniref:SEA domain-containing protein n=1 Tax=Pseudo-nitzschia multistriata TaxID=183589 RepID=A0A448ZJN7_9STRA|nr:unnamed protein product [Pseudo-nitzschia multistriata]
MILSRRCCSAQSIVFLLVALVLRAFGAVEIPLGAIILQLRSAVDTDAAELNERVEAITTNYLNQYFKAYYARTEPDDDEYFEKAVISANSFGVHGVEGSYITTLEIEGTLSFTSDEVPTSFFIETLLRNAFKGQNEKLFLDQLLKEDEDFLQNLTYLIIDINKTKVAESSVEDGAPSGDSSSSGVEASRANERRVLNEKWIIALLCVTSLIVALMILACYFYLRRRYTKPIAAKKTKKKADSDNEEPMKVIKLPLKKKQSSSTDDNVGGNLLISPTSAGTTPTSAGSLSDHMDHPPPSPIQSLTSHCSSMFTNGDNMSRFAIRKANNDVSKFSLDMPSIDLGTWRGGRVDPPEFGSDISAIVTRKDLSLIAEEKSDIESGVDTENNNRSRRKGFLGSRYSSRSSRGEISLRQAQSRSSYRSETYFYNCRNVPNDDSDSDCPLDTSAGDVICDLKNLSIQIERERNSRRSKHSTTHQ